MKNREEKRKRKKEEEKKSPYDGRIGMVFLIASEREVSVVVGASFLPSIESHRLVGDFAPPTLLVDLSYPCRKGGVFFFCYRSL